MSDVPTVVDGYRVIYSDEETGAMLAAVSKVLSSGMLAQGKLVSEFEDAVASYHCVPTGIAVSSGTAALEIVYRWVDEESKNLGRHILLLPANTYYATLGAAFGTGLVPALYDAPYRVSLDQILYAVDRVGGVKSVAAVVVTHIGGAVSDDIGAIYDWCTDNDIFLIEDAAQAYGSVNARGRTPGECSDAAILSFYATKVIPLGEGGMILTRHSNLESFARLYRSHGKPKLSVSRHVSHGENLRMNEMIAAMGLVLVESWQQRQIELSFYIVRYRHLLMDYPRCVVVSYSNLDNGHKCIIVLREDCPSADAVKSVLSARGINLPGSVYSVPLYEQPVLKERFQTDDVDGMYPNTESWKVRHICLPLYAHMPFEVPDIVVHNLMEVLDDCQS